MRLGFASDRASRTAPRYRFLESRAEQRFLAAVSSLGCDDFGSGFLPLAVAGSFPQGEAFEILSGKLSAARCGDGMDLVQAIAATEHRGAEAVIARRLDSIMAEPGLMAPHDWMNELASEAGHCIEFLIELGADPSDFEAQVRLLVTHPCANDVRSLKDNLGYSAASAISRCQAAPWAFPRRASLVARWRW